MQTSKTYKVPYDTGREEFIYQDEDFRIEHTTDIIKAFVNETYEECMNWNDIQNKNVEIRTYQMVNIGDGFEIKLIKSEIPKHRIKYIINCGEFNYGIPQVTDTSYGCHRVYKIIGDTYFAEDHDTEHFNMIMSGKAPF